MNRLEEIRKIVDSIILAITDTGERRAAYIHLYGVSQAASMLALKRGLDPELAAISGMLHDIYAYQTGVKEFHDQSGAEMIRPIILEMGIFTPEEQEIITSAVFYHGDKANIHQPYDELLKDADVLQYYLYNTGLPGIQSRALRLNAILEEVGLPPCLETKQAELNSQIAVKEE